MAKKKSIFGVNNYHKRTPKKRPGVHTKNKNKRIVLKGLKEGVWALTPPPSTGPKGGIAKKCLF